MPYLMHIAFDNPFRLLRNVYYFEYNGVRFKLIQNDPRKWADVLLTIVNDTYSAAAQRAFRTAGEFASCLGWVKNAGIPVRHIGGHGVRAGFTLRKARCKTFDFPQVPFRGMHVGLSISQIAKISNDEQRMGLTLYREAHSSNKDLFSLLLYWQVLEIRHNAVGWANKIESKNPQALRHLRDDLRRLPLKGRRLGEYLLQDCRHAIAHIRRKPGKTSLKFDNGEENARIAISARITRRLAEHYISTELAVTDMMYLVRRRGRGFPRYVDEAALTTGLYTLVSEPKPRLL